jgi:hypothetical protein
MIDYDKIFGCVLFLCLFFGVQILGYAQQSSTVFQRNGDRLTYFSDHEGNRIPDFSHAGYRGGGVELPYYPVKISISPKEGDDTESINGAIAYVEGLAPDENGIRGAVLLEPGIYQISGQLNIKESGVVLRGSGSGSEPENATILQVSKSFRGSVVQIGNKDYNWLYDFRSHRTFVSTEFVPVGSRNFAVEDIGTFEVGDNIIIRHRSLQKWLDAINGGDTGTDPPWEEGYIEIYYNRVITGIKDSTISIDAPIFNHLDRSLSETQVFRQRRDNLVEESGVEYLRIVIETDGETSETHAENGVVFTGVENGWARHINVFHFSTSGFATKNSKNITILNSGAREPHSSDTGERRYNFNAQFFSNNILFQNVRSSNGRRSFVSNGTSVASGIVFLNAHSTGALNSSEGHQKWSQGLLYDNITFENPQTYFVLGLYNRGDLGSSHGWGAVHSVAWNVDAAGQQVIIQKPPTAQNYAIGNKGVVTGNGIYDHPAGYIQGTNTDPVPQSLYIAQLNERLEHGVPPDAPAQLKVSNENKNQLDLSWIHSSVKETEFIIERSSDGGSTFETIDVVQANDSSYSDQSLGEKLYHYRVQARDANGRSAYSNVASGQASFTNEYLSDFHLVKPLNQTEISIDADPDNMITFGWNITENDLEIEFTWLLDRPAGDFSEPLTEISTGSSNELSITYREFINYLQQADITIDSVYAVKWTVKATSKTLEKSASEQFFMTLVKDPDSNILDNTDKETELDQNYPNPFNPITTIRFFLSEESDVSIDVFDLAGFKVATLEKGFKEPGYHDVEFDGSHFASGIYLYRLKTKNLVTSRKMILIK